MESLQVNHERDREGKFFAFVKFHRNEAAERALKGDKPFKGQKLLVNWVISFND